MKTRDLAAMLVAWLIGACFGALLGNILGQRLAHDECIMRDCETMCPGRGSLEGNWSMDWRDWTCRCPANTGDKP